MCFPKAEFSFIEIICFREMDAWTRHGFIVLSSSSWIKDFFHNGRHDYYSIKNMQMSLLGPHFGVKIPLILSMLTALGWLIYLKCIQKNKNIARYL